jgi:hypothetical protein
VDHKLKETICLIITHPFVMIIMLLDTMTSIEVDIIVVVIIDTIIVTIIIDIEGVIIKDTKKVR